jgi:hypothetical protein
VPRSMVKPGGGIHFHGAPGTFGTRNLRHPEPSAPGTFGTRNLWNLWNLWNLFLAPALLYASAVRREHVGERLKGRYVELL